MLSTAVVIALQYFCSDRALFSFERSQQAFWISIVVLTLSLLALSFALHAFDKCKDVYSRRTSKRPERIVLPTSYVYAWFVAYLRHVLTYMTVEILLRCKDVRISVANHSDILSGGLHRYLTLLHESENHLS